MAKKKTEQEKNREAGLKTAQKIVAELQRGAKNDEVVVLIVTRDKDNVNELTTLGVMMGNPKFLVLGISQISKANKLNMVSLMKEMLPGVEAQLKGEK